MNWGILYRITGLYFSKVPKCGSQRKVSQDWRLWKWWWLSAICNYQSDLSPNRHWKHGRTWVGLTIPWQCYSSVPWLVLAFMRAVYKNVLACRMCLVRCWEEHCVHKQLSNCSIEKYLFNFSVILKLSSSKKQVQTKDKSMIWSLDRYVIYILMIRKHQGPFSQCEGQK